MTKILIEKGGALKNSRHERFAIALANGVPQTRAYIQAGYSEKGASGSASQLQANPSISARVKEIKQLNLERNNMNLDTILAEIENTRKLAIALGQCHAAIAASVAKAKFLGLL